MEDGANRIAASGRACGRSLKRSEEHTSELQSRLHLVCRLLLEKKKKIQDVIGNEAHGVTSTLITLFTDSRNNAITRAHQRTHLTAIHSPDSHALLVYHTIQRV